MDEKEYGKSTGASKSRLGLRELRTEGRPRGFSIASSSLLLSLILSSDPDSALTTIGHDFPCSIDKPPPVDVHDEQLVTVLTSAPPSQGSGKKRDSWDVCVVD